ncbi:MAG: transposase family protein, partial [Pseudonocardiales bacterium]|nr:transposase family protein [Pseudonocardiales bacterium]
MNDAARDDEKATWPPILGLFKSVVVTLTYLRRNRVQAEIGEAFNVSQSTISRAIQAVTLLLSDVLAEYVPTADELDEQAQYLVDGTLLPCWSWKSHPQLAVSIGHGDTVLLDKLFEDLDRLSPVERLAWSAIQFCCYSIKFFLGVQG